MFNQQEEWIRERCGKFTASEIHKLTEKGRQSEYFGKGAKTYITQKAAEILTLEPNNGGRINGYALEWGNAHEHEAIKEFEKRTGKTVEYYGGANPKFFPLTDFSGGSPDGIIHKEAIIEIKCPYNSSEHFEHLLLDDADAIKSYCPEYYWQMVMNMLCVGVNKAYFISYDPRYIDEDLKIKVVEFDLNKEHAEQLAERIKEAEKQLTVTVNLVRDF